MTCPGCGGAAVIVRWGLLPFAGVTAWGLYATIAGQKRNTVW